MTQDAWLRTHPYLEPIAQLHAQIDAAVAEIPATRCTVDWEDYGNDFLRGVPLLRSSAVGIDYAPVEKIIRLYVDRLALSSLPTGLAEQVESLGNELRRDPYAARHLIPGLLNDAPDTRSCSGLQRYLGWTALAQYLRPLIEMFGEWRDEERWLRNYCPTCGSPPAMAQLVGIDQGRQRFLACGCCRTRWRYLRTGCPFCGDADDHRLAALTVEGEGDLRIDYCKSCMDYLKTYVGVGSESVLLADWTSVHLDVVARDRGLIRLAGSMYEL